MPTQNNLQSQFMELLASHQGILPSVARTYCWNQHDREDLIQEMTTQLWSAFASYDKERTFSTWMYRVALNTAIDYVRRKKLESKRSLDLAQSQAMQKTTQDPHEHEDLFELIEKFLSQLASYDRALMMLYLEQQSHADIADILGISISNVSTKLNRLRQQLNSWLATN